MSKLMDDPGRIAPRRAIIIALVISLVIFGISFLIDFNFVLTLLFLWLGTLANLISFKLIVLGASRVADKAESGAKPTKLAGNLGIRYALYIAVLVLSAIFGGLPEMFAALCGIQMVQWAILIDKMVG